MTLSEIQSYKTIQDPVLPSVTNIPISGSVKEKDSDDNIAASDINVSKISEEAKNASEEKIQRVSELMNDYVQSMKREIKIQVNNGTGDIVVRVIEEESGKVIREIPSEEMLKLAARIEELAGTLFDQTV